ncbi:hypothetical protein CCP2SC5_180020 [Azospirillaceae bacterium]
MQIGIHFSNAIVSHLWRGFANCVETLIVWMERAEQRRFLCALDERFAHDVGLERAAIEAEVGKPFWRR